MKRIRSLALLVALSAVPVSAAPLQITGRILHPPKDVQVELRPWAVDYAEALKRLKGETIPPLASAKPRADGSFALQVPDTGFYSVVARAEGHLAMERLVRFVVEETEVPPVELAPASPLEVKAVGPDGQPLAGVTIQAIPRKPESDEWRAAERSAVTDAEGRAVFLRARGEALTLSVTTPGRYATASTGPTGASQTLRFPALQTRTVQFQRPDGKPAAGALVRLTRREWPYGLTGEDGRIPLPVPLAKESIGLVAEDSRGRRAESLLRLETDTPVFTLQPPATVSGRVLDASTPEPIAGALVWNGGSSWTRTGAEGTFEIRAPEEARIEAAAAGHLVQVQFWRKDRDGAVTFLLEATAPISGLVVDEAGSPVGGARVTTFVNSARGSVQEERSASSGPDGRFSLRKLPAGRLHALEAVREGFAPARRLADSTAPVQLVLRRGALAFGRIVDEEGVPVPGARVSLTTEGEPGAPFRHQPLHATADPDGRFELPRAGAGRHGLRAESPGFVAAVEQVFIPEQEPEVDLGEIRLQAGGVIEGVVTDARGRPVEKALILARPSVQDRSPMRTGADGSFRIEGLPRGARYDLAVLHADHPAEEVGVVEVPTAEPLRIRLRPSRTLSGRVIDVHGEPVAGAAVFCRGSGVLTDPEGRFRCNSMAPGAVDLSARAPGYRDRSVPVQVPEERDPAPVEIVLEPGASLEGVVLDSEGRPVHRARVEIPSSRGTTSDPAGRYEILDLETGPCEVVASLLERGGILRTAVEIRPGRNRLDLRFDPGVEVSGRVVDSEGEPLPGATVRLLQPTVMREGLRVVSSADGTFVLRDVADGTYQLIATRPGFRHVNSRMLQIGGEPQTGLELELVEVVPNPERR